MEWTQCLICVKDLEESRTPLRSFYQVLKYLLHSDSDDNFKSINCDWIGNESSDIPAEVCDCCCEQLIRMKSLHVDLEVVQMKLIDCIKTLRIKIISNSKEYGTNDHSKVKLALFEKWLEEQNAIGFTHDPEKQLIKKLYSFQSTVFDRARKSVQLPLVYLKAFSNQSGIPIPPLSENDLLQVDPQTTEVEIKTEDNFPFEQEDEFDPIPSPGSPDVTLKLPKRKRCRPPSKRRPGLQTIARLIGQRLCKENPQDEEYLPKEKKRRPLSKEPIPKTIRVSSNRSAADAAKAHLFLSSTTVKPPANKSKKAPQRISRATIHPNFVKKFKQGKVIRDRLTCNLCKFDTQYQFGFEQHVRGHEASNPNKTLACTLCPEKFSTQLGLDFHNSYHSGFFTFRCHNCSTKILPLEFASHLATHAEKVFPCPNCSYCSLTREQYLIHLKRHTSDTGKFICDICSNNFPNRSLLILHLNQAHQALDKFTCPYEGCGRSYSLQGTLNRHLKFHSTLFVCKECGKPCNSVQSLEQHLKIHLDKSVREPEHCCAECPAKFLDSTQLNGHMIKVHGRPKYKCEPCGVEYILKGSWLEHNNLVHVGIKWKCTVEGCGKEFGLAVRLRQHVRRKHTEKPPGVCEECGMEFRSELGLKKHLARHADKREHVCPQCGKGFNDKVYLTRHMLIHKDEKKFVCETCGKGFNQNAALYLHRKTHKVKEDGETMESKKLRPKLYEKC